MVVGGGGALPGISVATPLVWGFMAVSMVVLSIFAVTDLWTRHGCRGTDDWR